MNTKKHTNKLQKSSVLFLQLGLVLSLLATYFVLEHKTEHKAVALEKNIIETDEPYEFTTIKEFRIEEKIVNKHTQIAKKQPIIEFVIDDTPTQKDIISIVSPIDPDKENHLDLSGLVSVDDPEPLDDDKHLNIDFVDEVPVFPGCEKVKKSKRRACFEKKMQKHIQRKFNRELSNQLGLSSGVQKIYVQFLISKTGNIEVINARAPHQKLMKEGKRVVKKLPKMTPGKQNGRNVGVKYTLPISFKVD